ncbi:beta-propeller domain-containing protein [Candidatus Nanosalina sp. VS9-1]|uniref:beta-propeller domain-containing protein n=1 Tax=Candidatus Nanosalina sp. VS9-1 TaxID=3388566 RepID=UPI0039E13602
MRDYLIFALATAFIATGSMLYMTENPSQNNSGLQKFSSEAEYREFVSSSGNDLVGNPAEALDRSTSNFAGGDGGSTVERSSDTNIQTLGVDEPDMLKNAGDKIFYSPERNYFYGYNPLGPNTSVFSTLPAENFSEIDELEASGRMFLTNNSVISLGQNISAFDRETHELLWEEELNSSIESARKINDSLYFVLAKNAGGPCPVRPLSSRIMPCTTFYHPGSGSADTTYSLVEMDASSGEVLNTNGFVGKRSNSVTYVSDQAIYLTYSEEASRTDLMVEFLNAEGDRYLDSETMERIEELQSYDLSESSLQTEINRAIEKYFSGLEKEEREEASQALENGFGNYTDDRKRELSTTSIAKFDLDLELVAEGEVPGTVNDRFSLDESDSGLRIATTVGSSWQFDVESENDLYSLDEDLEVLGSVQGMGLNERIYSARFIDDKAYIVTFRRVDPFHVIDLSDPENPSLEGELKLPGFSSYLHPLQENRILGIGEENGSVKAVIFDVEDDDPEVVDSMILDDYYSEISSSHHAFQIDRENEVFFLPGSEGGHFFSYSEGLEEVMQVEMTDVKRAAFVNQNFYVFNSTHASVVDIETWDTVKEIQFRESYVPKPVPLPGPVVR